MGYEFIVTLIVRFLGSPLSHLRLATSALPLLSLWLYPRRLEGELFESSPQRGGAWPHAQLRGFRDTSASGFGRCILARSAIASSNFFADRL